MPLFSTRLTATVTVALVLLLLGIAAFIGLAARSAVTDIRSSLGFTVLFDDTATETDINMTRGEIARRPFVAEYTFSTPQDVMDRWNSMLGDSQEKDLAQLLDTIPFTAEMEVNVREEWSSPDSLEAVAARMRSLPAVAEVETHADVARQVGGAVTNLTLILLAVAGVLLIISFVLINNTVRLTVYSRRFSIYTMKLVGATPGFIRAPFVRANLLAGLIAGLAADAVLGGALAYAFRALPSLPAIIGPAKTAYVLTALPLAGMIICLLASWFAAGRYLRLSHDEMFK